MLREKKGRTYLSVCKEQLEKSQRHLDNQISVYSTCLPAWMGCC